MDSSQERTLLRSWAHSNDVPNECLSNSYPNSRPRRSTRTSSKVIPPEPDISEVTSNKRKHETSDTADVQQLIPPKRSKQSPESSNPGDFKAAASIGYWCEAGTWPEELVAMDPVQRHPRIEMLAEPRYIVRKRSIGGSAINPAPTESTSQAVSESEYNSKLYPGKLESLGYYMYKGLRQTSGPCDTDLDMITSLLSKDSSILPLQSRFDDDKFRDTCLRLENQNESKIERDIGELIFPGPSYPSLSQTHARKLMDLVDEVWMKAKPITSTRPKPDVSVGFNPQAFPATQLEKLQPFLGSAGTEATLFAATQTTIFPFIACERKRAGGPLNVAGNENAHSMFIAVRAIVKLHELAGRDIQDLHRRVLAFSVSHNDNEVLIHAYYPLFEQGKITYHRHEISRYLMQAENGRDRWKAFRFVSNVYQDWAPKHLDFILDTVDKIPRDGEDVNNNEAQVTGALQYLAASCNRPNPDNAI